MRLALVILASFAVVGCDAVSDDRPGWAEIGAVAVFDYQAGPDSLRPFVSDGTSGAFRALSSQPRAFEMAVVASERWRRTDRHVVWRATALPPAFVSFGSDVPFPLADDDVEVVADGVAVVVDVDCSGGWLSGSSGGRLSFLRAPNRTGTIEEFGNCQRSHDLSGITYSATGPETVTVPAGTFSAIRVERPLYAGGVTIEFWTPEAGLVRLDVVGAEGVLRGRFVRSAGP